jgi:hypothetical protein
MRDLLITHLAQNSEARRRFLENTGPDGLMLAISSAGGAGGDRTLPLLRDEADWDRLGIRTREIAASLNDSAVFAMVDALLRASQSVTGSQRQQLDPTGRLGDLVSVCLEVVRARWDSTGTAISPFMLRLFTRHSQFQNPLPPMPRLLGTWRAYAPANRAEAEELTPDQLEDWGEICQTISDSEPRFLRQVDFPRSFREVSLGAADSLRATLENVETIDNEDPYDHPHDPDDPDYNDYDDEEPSQAEELGVAERAIDALAVLWAASGLEEEIANLNSELRDQREIREQREAIYLARSRPEPDHDEREDRFGGNREDRFDIHALFSDL